MHSNMLARHSTEQQSRIRRASGDDVFRSNQRQSRQNCLYRRDHCLILGRLHAQSCGARQYCGAVLYLAFYCARRICAHQANVQAPKRWLMILKTIELVLALISAIAIYFELGWLLLLCIAGFGVQSALIGPLKYALIPQLTEPADLLNKNAWMESATFVAILIGTLIASDWILHSTNHLITLILPMACTGLIGVFFLPHFDGRADHNQRSIQYLVHQQRQDRQSMSAIWCISGFWGVGSVWLTHLPMLAVDTWQLSPQSIGTLLSYFVLGVTLGACLGVLLKERHLTTRVIAGASTMVFGALILQVSDFQTATIGLVLTSGRRIPCITALYITCKMTRRSSLTVLL